MSLFTTPINVKPEAWHKRSGGSAIDGLVYVKDGIITPRHRHGIFRICQRTGQEIAMRWDDRAQRFVDFMLVKKPLSAAIESINAR